jgi:hypothetical protein
MAVVSYALAVGAPLKDPEKLRTSIPSQPDLTSTLTSASADIVVGINMTNITTITQLKRCFDAFLLLARGNAAFKP